MAYSSNGITWTGLLKTVFSVQGNGIASRRTLPYIGLEVTKPSGINYGNYLYWDNSINRVPGRWASEIRNKSWCLVLDGLIKNRLQLRSE